MNVSEIDRSGIDRNLILGACGIAVILIPLFYSNARRGNPSGNRVVQFGKCLLLGSVISLFLGGLLREYGVIFFGLAIFSLPFVVLGLAGGLLEVGFERISERINRKKPRAEEQARLAVEQQKTKAIQFLAEERARNLWSHYYSMFDERHVSEMSGSAFEKFLGKLYSRLGYEVALTSSGADQGADLILNKDNRRIAVQAKRWNRSVGNTAVQEIMAGKIFYGCAEGIVVTTATFSRSAVTLAATDPTISLIDGRALGLLCKQFRTDVIPEFCWEAWKQIEPIAEQFA